MYKSTKSEILICQSESDDTKFDVYLEDGFVHLSQVLITELYQITSQSIIIITKNIYKDEKLTLD